MNYFDFQKSIGGFIKDHGIAVFLVVFFILVIYPEQSAERKEWITEITKLQTSLDPAKRPLSKEQASIILDLTTEAYKLAIESSMNLQGYGSYIEGGGSGDFNHHREGQEPIETIILGTTFSIDPESQDLDALANKAHTKFLRILRKESLFIGQAVSLSLEKSLGSARFATARLSSFKYENLNLAEYSEYSFNNHYKDFSKSLINAHKNKKENSYVRDQFLDFLESTGATIPENLSTIKEYDQPSQVIFSFKTNLKKSWKNLLLKFPVN